MIGGERSQFFTGTQEEFYCFVGVLLADRAIAVDDLTSNAQSVSL